MRSILIAAVLVSVCLAVGCSKAKPSPDALTKALTAFVQKDNPQAKVEGVKLDSMDAGETMMSVKFGYKDFTYTSKSGEKKTESGTGTATFDGMGGKWVLERVMINYGSPDAEIWEPKTEVK